MTRPKGLASFDRFTEEAQQFNDEGSEQRPEFGIDYT